jgi:preprotein translocase SecE subunit
MTFAIYKRGQGKYTRLCSAGVMGIIVALGCLRLYDWLGPTATEYVNPRTALWIATMVPAGLFVVLALLILWLVNKRSAADFMIAAEGEIKKVSWSSRKEIAVSTLIVIIVVVVMAVLLGVADVVFHGFFTWLFQ